MDGHAAHCGVWDWSFGIRTYDVTKMCSCGYRDEQEEKRRQELTRHRPLRPLGMSDEDFLRSMGIEPL